MRAHPVLELTWTRRAGVIPYTCVNNKLYFLLGKDTKTKELTDFGGGVKLTETSLKGAVREFKEETSGIFGKNVYDITNFLTSFALTDGKNMTIVFLYIDDGWMRIAKQKFAERKNREICELQWISEEEFRNLINSSSVVIWSKVRKFLQKTIPPYFYTLLKIQ